MSRSSRERPAPRFDGFESRWLFRGVSLERFGGVLVDDGEDEDEAAPGFEGSGHGVIRARLAVGFLGQGCSVLHALDANGRRADER